MNAHDLLSFKLVGEKEIKYEACQASYPFFAMRLINSIIKYSIYHMTLKLL